MQSSIRISNPDTCLGFGTISLPILFLVLAILIGIAGCRRSQSSGETTAIPSHAGEVWEIDSTAGRAAMPAAVLAYVNGLAVLVLDGDVAYAGMTSLKVQNQSNGAREIQLAGGLSAALIPVSGGRVNLLFSTGESIPMHRR